MKKGLEKYRENIKILMKKHKIKSIQELACSCGISTSTVKKLINMTIDPQVKDGKYWRPSVLKIARRLNINPQTLFLECSYEGRIKQIGELKGVFPKDIFNMPYITQKRNEKESR